MYTSAERRAWLAHYEATGSNVAQTCQHYGISRATFYKWQARYDSAQPQKPLRARTRRPHARRKARWTRGDLVALSDVCVRHPTWGRRRLHALRRAHDHELALSERTVGRMLQRIHQRCPVCHGRHGQHDRLRHLGMPAAGQDRTQPSLPPLSYADGAMQPVITRGLDALLRAWEAASPEARHIFRQQHATKAEIAAPRRSSAKTEQNAEVIAALFQQT